LQDPRAHHQARAVPPRRPRRRARESRRSRAANRPRTPRSGSLLCAPLLRGSDAAELVAREFAELSKAVCPELEDMERLWTDRVGRTERDMNSECSQRLQKQRASFWKDIEAEEAKREAALAECRREHQAALKELSGQYEKAFEEMRVQFERACEEGEQRRVRDLASLQAQFEQEAAVWNGKYQSETAAANDRVSAEMASRLQAEEELASSRAASSKLQGDLESAQAQILKIQKEVLDEARKREAEDAARKEKEGRREKEDEERAQDRLLQKEEMTRERTLFQARLDAKQEQLDSALEQVSGLKVSLQRKKEQYRTLLNDTNSSEARITELSDDLSYAESTQRKAEAKQKAAESNLKTAVEERKTAEKLLREVEKKYRTCERDMMSAKLAQGMAEDERKNVQRQLDDALFRHKVELAEKHMAIDRLRKQLAVAKTSSGSSSGGAGGAEVHRRMHDSLWAYISGSPLKFNMIGWPVTNGAKSLEDLTPSAIRIFVLDSRYAQGKSDRDRVREAIRTWHPDKFNQRLAGRIAEEDRASIKEGVDIVSKCLNASPHLMDYGPPLRGINLELAKQEFSGGLRTRPQALARRLCHHAENKERRRMEI
ncbi:hypothetical protein EVG20_g1760, partial [Dentipellis fragilis]